MSAPNTQASNPNVAQTAIEEAVADGVKSSEVDGIKETGYGVDELIAADDHLAKKRAAQKPLCGIAFTTFVHGR